MPLTIPPVLAPVRSTADTDFYAITQQAAAADILPGLKTTIWGYNGITPGPTIVVPRGRKTVVRHVNALPRVHPTLRYTVWTSTHLHGSASLPQFDGYASDITNVGQFKDYEYPNAQEARTIWYHDHGVHITAPNAYMGLAGALPHRTTTSSSPCRSRTAGTTSRWPSRTRCSRTPAS